MNSLDISRQSKQTATLHDAIRFARLGLDEFGKVIGNDQEFFRIKDTADEILARHLQHPGLAIADDVAHLRSLFGRLPIPREDPDVGPLPRLKKLRAARGNLLADLDDILTAASSLGWRPAVPALPDITSTTIAGFGLDKVLLALVTRINAVEDQLKKSIEPESQGGQGRELVQIGLVNAYVKTMKTELSLARLEAGPKSLIDFVALARAVSNIGRMTADFVVTVRGFGAKATKELHRAADAIAPKVRKVVTGFRTIVGSVLRHRKSASSVAQKPGESAPPEAGHGVFDLDQVHAMILRGEAPPKRWQPLITDLNFRLTELRNLEPLAGLVNLQTLLLKETQVSDVTPLAGLAALQHIDLMGTQVSDVGPLAALTNLQSLDLDGTEVSDVRPLASLANLRSLDLQGTQVSDITPLAGLLSLRSLDLGGTQVSDVKPLSRLTNLLSLDLQVTPVSDVTPLSGLTGLQTLYLLGTQVTDIEALADLTSLQRLYLHNTQINDVTPLGGLTRMQLLNLQGTLVGDLTPLVGLTSLQTLDLRGTFVSDVAPLAGLTGLQRLDLRKTWVTDVAPLAGLSNLERLDLRDTNVRDVSVLVGIEKRAIVR
jgi:Leucine-rich repeat (LRR) protein